MRLSLVLLVLLLAGCTKEPPSEIVQKVEAAGAGNLRAASQQSIEDWFKKHADYAVSDKRRMPAHSGESARDLVEYD